MSTYNFLPSLGEILSDVKFVFLIDTTFESGLSNSSSNKFKTMEEKIRLSVSRSFSASYY